MSTEVAVIQDLSREKVDLIKQTVAKGATDLELDLFLHACKRTGLDPLMKQIYAIKRWSAADNREVMSFQTGIDGYRLIADRTGKYAGSDEPQYTIAEDGWPEVASVTVTKMIDGVPCKFSASARWKEYVQKNKQGQPTSMWQKMPFLMLGKCAEALALRKAFPAELSGVYTHEEMMQADTELQAHPIIANKQTAQAKIAELRQEMQKPARQDGGAPHEPNGEHAALATSASREDSPQQGLDAAAPFISDWKVPNVAWMKPDCGKRADELDDATLTKFVNYYEGKLAKEPQSRYRGEWDDALRALVAVAMHREQSNPSLL